MITNKPWGSEELLEKNDKYVVKKLFMKAGHSCSLQYHERKHETFYVLSGRLMLSVGDAVDNLDGYVFEPGRYLALPPGKIHKMSAIEDCFYLECSTPELDDVIRLQDAYGRVK